MSAWTPLEFRRLAPRLEPSLGAFFEALQANGDHAYFHPHPLTREEAHRLCYYEGKDLYYAACGGREILGYGILRGWDDGFAVPSLGIAIAPQARGQGLALALMHFLHAAARQRGAGAIRLKVYEANSAARRLYERLGYRYQPLPDGQLLGLLPLAG
jgi:ribosomal protein S18 acetylase RimI-like enzyme